MDAKPFPLNAWYAAAWSHEIKHELAARTVCEKDIVLYRRSDGEIAALEDACWHRLLPLSLGHLRGDEVVCGYHGLVFNAAGRCTYMPAQDTINPSACVRAYPLVERHRLVWVWMGDPALADPARIPDLHWNSDEAWAGAAATVTESAVRRTIARVRLDTELFLSRRRRLIVVCIPRQWQSSSTCIHSDVNIH